MSYPILLTPGPLTTSTRTKEAMLSDWGSWDASFNDLTASVCKDIVDIVNGQGTHVCVPMQGSGTFSVEAALGTLVPKTGKVLVPANGAYCQRIARILKYLNRAVVVLEHGEDEPVNPERIDASRRKRIAKGSGKEIADVNAFMKQFEQMSKMMKMMQGPGGKNMMKMMGNMKGMPGGMPGMR